MKVLLDAARIQARVRELAAQIDADYPANEGLHLVCVLKGDSCCWRIWCGDGERVTLDFMAVSSYAKEHEFRRSPHLKDSTSLDGQNVIIVEDIVDTGLTLTYLQDILRARGPKTLRTACLLSKPSRRKVDVKVEIHRLHHRRSVRRRLRLDYTRNTEPPHIAELEGE